MIEQMSLSEKITYSTVLLKCTDKNHKVSLGTGFIVHFNSKDNSKYIAAVITNKHVVKNSVMTQFELCTCDADGNICNTKTAPFTYDGCPWIEHPSLSVDLCCLPITDALDNVIKQGIHTFYIPLDMSLIPSQEEIENMTAIENIVMVGYPIGFSDVYNHKPIIRKGITATHIKNNYNGKKEFLIDIASFHGCSGSPVFVLNEGLYTDKSGAYLGNNIKFVGVLYGGLEYNAEGILKFDYIPCIPRPVTSFPINIGVIVKAEEIFEFDRFFESILNQNTSDK
ncbi:MAG: serine protease [Alphaproteobacteria bacterium]|nr:serine protease [Alphaproteobacteria bacterium]